MPNQKFADFKKHLFFLKKIVLEIEILLLFLLNLAIFWPGSLSPDSVSQYYQAATGEYTNWHPPIFSFAWSWTLGLFSGSKGMLLFQLLMLWISILLIAKIARKYSKKHTYLLMPLIGLAPQVISISGVIWKDVHLAYALLLCTALIFYVRIIKPNLKKRVALISLATVSLIYAANLRHNAIFAILPIIYLYVQAVNDEIPIKYKKGKNKIRLFVLTFLSFTAFTYIFVPFSLSKIINIVDLKPGYQIIFDDIYNLNNRDTISKNTKLDNSSKKYILTLYENCPKINYKTNTLWDCDGGDLYFASVRNDSDVLRKLWISSILDSPVEYIKYRSVIYYNFLRTTNPYIWNIGLWDNSLQSPESKLNSYSYKFINIIEEDFGFIFRNYLGLLVGIIVLLMIVKYKLLYTDKIINNTIILVLLSSILYVISYFPIVVVGDYRMVYWSTLSVSIYLWFILLCLLNNIKLSKWKVHNEK